MASTDFDTKPTETLLVLRENLWNGLGVIGEHFINGTAHDQSSKGAASPAQFGACLTLPLFFRINTILVERGEEDYTARL